MKNGDNSAGRVLGRFFRPVPPGLRAQFKAQRIKTNVNRMFALSIYIIVIQIVLNIINILRPSEGGDAGNIGMYVTLSLVTLSVGVVYMLLLLQAKKGRIQSEGAKRFLINSLLYIYIGIQMVFCTLNVIATGGVNSYIIAILILCMFPVIRPVQSITSTLVCFAYLLVAMYVTRGISSAWDSIMLTDTWTNLIIITGITMCISVFIYNIYVDNFMRSMELEKSNAELVGANEKLAEANEKLEIAANTDQMTGVLNRRAFSRDYEEIWNSSLLKKARIATAIFDIDFFKAYNDKFGHLEGDKCLQMIAGSLRDSFRRQYDIVSRFGGEEFLVVFDASEQDAYALVNNARQHVEDLHIPHAKKTVSPYVTVSAGVCVMVPSEAVDNDIALRMADDALYESKRGGRNKITMKIYEKEAEKEEKSGS